MNFSVAGDHGDRTGDQPSVDVALQYLSHSSQPLR
jgi:hypothetical protein